MLDFGEITAPVTPEQFLSAYWTRRAVHLREPSRTFERYFGWSALNALLNSGDLTFPSTLVSREERVIPSEEFTQGDGRVVDPADVMRLFRDGASFSIRGADTHWPPLKAILAGLSDTFFETIHTNVYCSPAQTQGFRCHYDLHEVFVLQVEGAKHWKVFDATTDVPVEPWRPEDAPDTAAAPYVDVTLCKGDVLYVPRGHWHYATAEASHSLHITVGVTCRKGDSLLDWLGPQLREHTAWRRNVPVMGRPSADGRLAQSIDALAWAAELRRVMNETLAEPGLLERFVEDLFTGSRPTVTVNMPQDGTAGALPLEALEFSRPAGQRHVISQSDSDRITLKVGGTEMQLEGVSRELLAHVLGTSSFVLGDVERWAPGMSAADRAKLVETFVRSGLLIATPRIPL